MRTDGSRISSRSRGEFDANEWIREGDRMLASARSLRALWHVKRRKFNSALRNGQDGRDKRISEIEGFPRASMLLLGYAMEMFLKSGLAKAYRGCDKTMLARDLKKKFGHDYKALSKEICFPGADGFFEEFKLLEKFVLSDARYPVNELSHRNYSEVVNERVAKIWNKRNFQRLCKLTKSVRSYVLSINRDHNDSASFRTINIDSDGYLSFRSGGRLPPRITVRFSSEQCKRGENSVEALRKFLSYYKDYLLGIEASFSECYILEDRVADNSSNPQIKSQTVELQKPCPGILASRARCNKLTASGVAM